VTLGGAVLCTYAGFEANRYVAAMVSAALDVPASATGLGVILKHSTDSRFELDNVIRATRELFVDSPGRERSKYLPATSPTPLELGSIGRRLVFVPVSIWSDVA
jgi:hypothetical protein